jgi:radical SAM superfamily enzyme YgiQ (UPF0313 family)
VPCPTAELYTRAVVVLLSTYELGRPAFGPASAAAFLRDAGHPVRVVDLSRGPLPESLLAEARMFAVHTPMHAATRLAGPLLQRLRAERPEAVRVAYGLYAPLNAEWLREQGATHVLPPEAEAALVTLAGGDLAQPESLRGTRLPRLTFRVPDRSDQPPLAAFAQLNVGGDRRLAGYTEATRGCLHTCTHCPIVPIYEGTFRAVPADVVLADIDQQVAAGARHITFGDPDFLNGPGHARRLVEALARRHPDVTYDVTVKVEHLCAQPAMLDVLAATNCAFVTSAVEAFDDEILGHLQKGHTADDARRAIAACRARGLALVPTFVAFTPWTSPRGYLAMLEHLRSLDLIDAVAPVQLALRLLLPAGSPLLDDPDVRAVAAAFDPQALAHPWSHENPAVDRLQQEVLATVGAHATRASRRASYEAARRLAEAAADLSLTRLAPDAVRVRATVPYLDEPWYC